MLHGKRIVVVLPAYKAESTLKQTYADIPRDVVDLVLLVDDASDDGTVSLAHRLGIDTFVHKRNLFDNQMLAQVVACGFRIGEISCPTRYFAEASSINFRRSVIYGLGVIRTSVAYRLWRWRLLRPSLFSGSPMLRLKAYYSRAAGDAPSTKAM